MNTLGPNELADDIDMPLSLTSRLLSQVEGVGVDLYTINFTRLATRSINVGPQGSRLYNHCLTNLPIHGTGESKLQFAWGDKHMMRNLGVQLYEYEHLLLASALGEYFSEDYAAAVYNALADHFEDEDRPKPHVSSLRNFVHAANGILSTSDFPTVVDDRIRLNPYRHANDGLPFAKQPQETLSISKLGEAICMLGELKNGEPMELIFAGGDVLGWFSAYADMCLGIDVTLLDEDDKELHRANADVGWRLKLKFTRLETPMPDEGNSIIWLRDQALCKPATSLHATIHSGRITMNSLFNKVFGSAFHRLDQTEAKPFANALGGSARLLELLAADESTSAKLISAENRSNLASLGLGLIQTWSNWFPELRHLQGRMERALKLDEKAAAQQCEDSILHLESLCGCYICSPTQGLETRPKNLPRDGFCIPTLMETIIMLGLALSRVALTPNLHPSRAGVLGMYKSQMRKRLDLKKSNIDRRDPKRNYLLFNEDWNSTFPKRLQNVIAMFSGSWPKEDLPENLLGASHEGICAYSMMLERGDKRAKHPDDQVIRVVTGSINWRQKTLNRVCLGQVETPDTDVSWDSIQCNHFTERLYVK